MKTIAELVEEARQRRYELRADGTRCGKCGARSASAELLGDGWHYEIEHSRRCRVGRVLRQPGAMHQPGFEPLPVDDRRVVKIA